MFLYGIYCLCQFFLCFFYRVKFNTTATLPEITHAANLYTNMPNKYSTAEQILSLGYRIPST